MVKKNELEKIKTLDWVCGQSKHLHQVYSEELKKFPKTSVERLFFEKITGYYKDIMSGACSLFDLATEVSQTEYMPREMLEIKDYEEFIKKEASTVK